MMQSDSAASALADVLVSRSWLSQIRCPRGKVFVRAGSSTRGVACKVATRAARFRTFCSNLTSELRRAVLNRDFGGLHTGAAARSAF